MSTDGSMVGVDARALLKAARSAQARGEIGEAIAGNRAALALAPDLGAAAIGLCRILRENGERDAARREPTPAWDEIVTAARALDDPLALTCIESCRAEERDLALAGQTLWRAAAAQVLAAATVPAALRARATR